MSHCKRIAEQGLGGIATGKRYLAVQWIGRCAEP